MSKRTIYVLAGGSLLFAAEVLAKAAHIALSPFFGG